MLREWVKPEKLFWLLWLIIVAVYWTNLAGFALPDAKRYMAVSEHMLRFHQYFVPHLPHHQFLYKPPLMFWLFVSGWKVFGINHWWPQFVILAFATGSLALTRVLALQMWPERARVATLVPYILLGLFNWLLFNKQIRVDPLLTFFMIMGYLGLVWAWQGKLSGWWLYGFGLGFGLLCKGPPALIFLSLPALILPFFITIAQAKARWWLCWFFSTAFGLLMLLAWAVPAIKFGGPIYKHNILFGQMASRMAMHHLSAFYYIQNLPLWFLPWLLFVPMWVGLSRVLKKKLDCAWRFCLFVIVAALTLFSTFGQKGAHYLLPLYPLISLLIAYCIDTYIKEQRLVKRWHQWPLAIILLLGFIILLLSPWLPIHIIQVLGRQSILIAAAMLIFAGLLFLQRTQTVWGQCLLWTLPIVTFVPWIFILIRHPY